MLHLVLGVSGSGKSSHLLQTIWTKKVYHIRVGIANIT